MLSLCYVLLTSPSVLAKILKGFVTDRLEMKGVFALLIIAAVLATGAYGEPPLPAKLYVPNFTIHTSDPQRALYSIVRFLHENRNQIISQRVIGIMKYEFRIAFPEVGIILVLGLGATQEGLQAQESYMIGADSQRLGIVYKKIVEPLIVRFLEAGKE